GAPGFGSERSQRGRGMECAGPDFDVVGLEDDAPLLGPEVLQIEYQGLEAQDQPSTRSRITAAAGNRVCRSRAPRWQNRRRKPHTARDLRRGATDARVPAGGAAARAAARSASGSRSTPRQSPE